MWTYLIVADVVVALVYTPSVRAGLERGGDVLDIGNPVNEDGSRPAGLALHHRLEVDCIARKEARYVSQIGWTGVEEVARGSDRVPFFALYAQSRSWTQSRQRLASPASTGFLSLRKCCREPKDETRVGSPGDSQWQRISKSLVR